MIKSIYDQYISLFFEDEKETLAAWYKFCKFITIYIFTDISRAREVRNKQFLS